MPASIFRVSDDARIFEDDLLTEAQTIERHGIGKTNSFALWNGHEFEVMTHTGFWRSSDHVSLSFGTGSHTCLLYTSPSPRDS